MPSPDAAPSPRPQDAHDPGGKVRLALGATVRGSAVFSPCGRYRQVLWRTWGEADAPYVLWIGMNPSTADETVDDPTIRREYGFSMREGFFRMAKTNVMDFRATKPKELLDEGTVPCTAENLAAIRDLAEGAALVVLSFGALHPRLERHGRAIVDLLSELGIQPVCLGFTASGAPRHPLYVKGDAPLVPFPMPGRRAA